MDDEKDRATSVVAPPMEQIDLKDSALYINRELSLLEFNQRVLAQALDRETPLLERLRFLTICSTNLDEFFEIRVASHKERASIGSTFVGPDGLSALETLSAVSVSAHDLVDQQYEALNNVLLPELEKQDIRLLKRTQWTPEQREWIAEYFRSEVLPVLTPVGLDPAHPFPKILNKSLNFVVTVEGEDAFERTAGIAVVQIPRVLPRVINLPREIGQGRTDYVMLSSVVHAHVSELFPGMTVSECHQFRVTRNGDLWVDEEEVDDILKALEGELPERQYGAAVRLEVTNDCPEAVADFLLEKFQLHGEDLYRVNEPVNLHRLVALHDLVDRPDLKFASFVPRVPRRIDRGENTFEALKKDDVLLHHPFESFAPVLEFVRQAAGDPGVVAIKQTLYRVGANSALVEALIEAARAGKEVTVVVELRARFDEAENINLANRLQDVGANVVYGVVGYKTHSKMLMVVRRESDGLRRYVHLGTGNYHAGTARAYTDIGFLTAREDIGKEVHDLFFHLTGLGRKPELSKLLHAPFTLLKSLIQRIDFEAQEALAGRASHIIAKMNALTEPSVIRALYRASQAGVSIDLIIRGACCLRPGVPGVSDNIRVRSIVGRFLEHTRIFYFHAAGEEMTYGSSADWMGRNLLRRVETTFPIEDPQLRERVLRECLDSYLKDNQQAWILLPTGKYERVLPDNGSMLSAQSHLLESIAGSDELEVDAESAQMAGLDVEVGAAKRARKKPSDGKAKQQRRRSGKKRDQR